MPAHTTGPEQPATPAKGDLWTDTVSEKTFRWNERGWEPVDNPTGNPEHDANLEDR